MATLHNNKNMSTESKYTKEFEDYWKTHEAALMRVAPKVLREERANNGKMNTAGDWLLFIIPIMAMVGFMNTDFIKGELVRFLVAMLIGIACFVFAVYIKPYVTGKRNIVDIDADIKDYFFAIYQKEGIKGLNNLMP